MYQKVKEMKTKKSLNDQPVGKVMTEEKAGDLITKKIKIVGEADPINIKSSLPLIIIDIGITLEAVIIIEAESKIN